jgi:hypothetical protein
MKTTIHIININNYFPEMTKLTIPTVERWAEKTLNAQLNVITKRKWPEWPLLYEKMQIYYDGDSSDWNILLDADVLIHPDTPNPLGTLIAPVQVASKDCYNADKQLVMDEYFFRDGRNIGISTCAVAASRLCHDLWTPLEDNFTPEIALTKVYKQRDIIDEYCVSRNLARYGLKFTAFLDPAKDYGKAFHLGAFGRDKNQMLDEAKEWYKKNWK